MPACRKRIAIALLLASLCAASHATDSTARIGAGGIELLKSADIVMSSELLEISQRQIHVKYSFRNEGKRDITTMVAFPLPSYGWNAGQSALDINVHPLRPFVVTVAGERIKVSMQRTANSNGNDITRGLRSAGFSDREIFDTFGDCTVESCEQSPLKKAAIQKLTGDEWPSWTVQETALWRQTFPKGKDLEVEHFYAPLVGGVYTVPYQSRKWMDNRSLPVPSRLTDSIELDEVCLDQGARAEIDQRMNELIAKGAKGLMVMLHDVEYILGTGRNWKGPIRNFTLRVEKGPEEIVSLCFDTPPTRKFPSLIEYHARDFVPPDRLVVHFYSVRVENL